MSDGTNLQIEETLVVDVGGCKSSGNAFVDCAKILKKHTFVNGNFFSLPQFGVNSHLCAD